jgi:aryl-alcohol dehydrogenase-like predicted oxidoreductase
MASKGAAASGRFEIGGDISVSRLGFGAMRITGKGVWGEPADGGEARRVLRRLPDLGIDFIDTADSYGPEVSERLIRETLHPYRGLLVATKGGLTRPGAGSWVPRGDPAYLRQCVEGSLGRLGVDRIDLWQLHRIDPKVPREDQLAAVKSMRDEGLIRHVGLSQVSVADIEAARRFFPVATVQNLYNVTDRKSEDVLGYCERSGIGFIPWYPLADGRLAQASPVVAEIAGRHAATAAQIALAWLLKRSPVMLPIPGTGRVAHLEENVGAAAISLSEADFSRLDEVGRPAGRP